MAATWPGFWSANMEGTVARMNATLVGNGTAAEIAALSVTTYAGCVMYATDTKQTWYSNGSAWVELAPGLNIAETIAGIKTFSSIPVLPASDPTTDNQAVRKIYLDKLTQSAFKSGDESVYDSSAYQNDDDLYLPVEANKHYLFMCQINATCSDNTPDIKAKLLPPSGYARGFAFFMDPGSWALDWNFTTGDIYAYADVGSSSGPIMLIGMADIGGTGGNLQLQWAQYSSGAYTTYVKAGSWLALIELRS